MNLLKAMKTGKVYRRKDLEPYSRSIDRDLANLTQRGEVEKLASGLYSKPKVSRFGPLPPKDQEVVRAFLKDSPFLLVSFNNYNTLGLGLTQLRNDTLVYNRRRHEEVFLGFKKFIFKNTPEFPKKLTREFLLVDLLNNINELGEDPKTVLFNLNRKKTEFDPAKLQQAATCYGRIKTKKFLKEIHG